MKQALWYENGIWREGTAADALAGCGRVISLVGGGGKTSLLYTLAAARQASGQRTAVLTTTKIFAPETFCRTAEACMTCWQNGQFAVCGEPAEQNKLGIPAPKLLTWLLQNADTLLIEADGAKHLPCKVPAAHEPVLLPETDTVIGVLGLDALGQPVGTICHRPELVCELLGCASDHLLTEHDLARILLSEHGTRKNIGERIYYVVLNKCDNAARETQGKHIAELLAAQNHANTVLTRLKEKDS